LIGRSLHALVTRVRTARGGLPWEGTAADDAAGGTHLAFARSVSTQSLAGFCDEARNIAQRPTTGQATTPERGVDPWGCGAFVTIGAFPKIADGLPRSHLAARSDAIR